MGGHSAGGGHSKTSSKSAVLTYAIIGATVLGICGVIYWFIPEGGGHTESSAQTSAGKVRHEYAAWTEVLAPSVDTPWEFVGNEVVAPIHRRICLRENPHKYQYQWQCEDATDGWRDYAPGQCDNAQAFRFRSTTPESKLIGYEFRKSC